MQISSCLRERAVSRVWPIFRGVECLQGTGGETVGGGSGVQQSGGVGGKRTQPLLSLAESSWESGDDKSDYGELLGDVDKSDDGEGLPGLHDFAEQLRDASGFGEDDVAEYMDDLITEAGTEPFRFTARDVTRAHSGRAV